MTLPHPSVGGCVAALVMGLVLGAATSLAWAQPLELSGSLKSLFLRSRASTGEDYALSLNRLRVEAKGDLAPGLSLDLHYDNELLLGTYLDTGEFRALKDLSQRHSTGEPTRTTWNVAMSTAVIVCIGRR